MLPGKKLLLRRRQKSADAGRRDPSPAGKTAGRGTNWARTPTPSSGPGPAAPSAPQGACLRNLHCGGPANDSRDRQAERPASHSADTCARVAYEAVCFRDF